MFGISHNFFIISILFSASSRVTKCKPRKKTVEKKKKVTVRSTARAAKRAGKRSAPMETATKTTNTTPMPVRKLTADASTKAETTEKTKAKRARRTTPGQKQTTKRRGRPSTATKVRVPRVVKSRKAIPLKKTPASLSINLRSQDLQKVESSVKSAALPRQSVSDSKLKSNAEEELRSECEERSQEAAV